MIYSVEHSKCLADQQIVNAFTSVFGSFMGTKEIIITQVDENVSKMEKSPSKDICKVVDIVFRLMRKATTFIDTNIKKEDKENNFIINIVLSTLISVALVFWVIPFVIWIIVAVWRKIRLLMIKIHRLFFPDPSKEEIRKNREQFINNQQSRNNKTKN